MIVVTEKILAHPAVYRQVGEARISEALFFEDAFSSWAEALDLPSGIDYMFVDTHIRRDFFYAKYYEDRYVLVNALYAGKDVNIHWDQVLHIAENYRLRLVDHFTVEDDQKMFVEVPKNWYGYFTRPLEESDARLNTKKELKQGLIHVEREHGRVAEWRAFG